MIALVHPAGLQQVVGEWLLRFAEALSRMRPAERQQSEALFRQAIEPHIPIINRICRSFASTAYEFEDLRQDALLNIWRGIANFKNDSDIKTWIYRVTLNTCVSTYRRRRKLEHTDISHASSVPSEEGSAPFEFRQWLDTIIADLNPENHSIFVLWLEDVPYDQIARIMGMNRNTVASRINRIKTRIRLLVQNPKIEQL